MKVATTFHRRLIFMARSLVEPIPHLQSQFHVEIRRLTETDLPAYGALRPDQPLNRIRARLAAGHYCHASWHEGRIVDAVWCVSGRGPVEYFSHDIILKTGDVYGYDAYTLPSHRAHNLFMAKVAHIFREYQAEGFTRHTALVAPENRASRAILKRLGAWEIGLYSSVGVGPWRVIWQESFGDESLPLLCPMHSVDSRQ
jgi:hypothetical protein